MYLGSSARSPAQSAMTAAYPRDISSRQSTEETGVAASGKYTTTGKGFRDEGRTQRTNTRATPSVVVGPLKYASKVRSPPDLVSASTLTPNGNAEAS